MFFNGKIAGISGILLRSVQGGALDLAFLASMGLAGSLALGAPPPAAASGGAPAAAAALAAAVLGGAVSGAGFAAASGCTSGHGVCGLGRASPRSLAAVATFMATGALSASAAPHFSAALARVGHALGAGAGGALGPLLALAPAALRPVVPLAALLLAGAAVVACGGGASANASAGAGAGAPPRPRGSASGAQLVASAACGALFGVGLAVSGMADPTVVRAFLNPWAPGGWNPRLMAVMGGAVAVTAPAFFFMAKRAAPPVLATEAGPLANAFAYGGAGPNTRVDARLLLGAAAFGAGWGLGGVCPGPGVVAACAGSETAFAAVLSSVVGALVWLRLWG